LETAFVTGTNWETCAIKKEIKKLEMGNSNYELQRIIRINKSFIATKTQRREVGFAIRLS
jgi:hypothetical protein